MTDTDRIRREIAVSASPARIWTALSDSRDYGQWFGAEFHDAFAEGAQIEGAVIGRDGTRYPLHMRILTLEPERRMVFQWPGYNSAGPLLDAPWLTVEYRIEPTDGGARVIVTETGFDSLPDSARQEARSGNESGWDHQAKNLAEHLA